MYDFKIDEFINDGSFFGYKTGDIIDSELLGLVVEKSIETNQNGVSELMVLKMGSMTITLGINEQDRIRYIMIKIPKHNENINLLYKSFSLTNNNLHKILNFLNSSSIEWSFKETLGKVLCIKINKIELIYSFEINEEGIYCIQTIAP